MNTCSAQLKLVVYRKKIENYFRGVKSLQKNVNPYLMDEMRTLFGLNTHAPNGIY